MLSPLYPAHYYLTRPFARKLYGAMESWPLTGTDTKKAQDLAAGELLPYLQAQGWKMDSIAVMSQELQGALGWMDWAINGRRVVGVSNALTHAFEHSDCGDLRISDVLPSQSFSLYLHFEGPLDEPISFGPKQSQFEGAYVICRAEHSIRVVLCSRLAPTESIYQRWRERYDLRIPAKYFEVSADEAIDYALADDLKDLENARSQMVARGAPGPAKDAEMLAERMQQDHPAYRRALRLVLNSLAYLKMYSADQERRWPEGAPQRMVQQAEQGTPKEQGRARSKLWALGHVPVEWIGSHFNRGPAGHGGVRAHWRRGHWRNQPHGPAMSLRKLIWIQPVLVGADQLADLEEAPVAPVDSPVVPPQ